MIDWHKSSVLIGLNALQAKSDMIGFNMNDGIFSTIN
jgi:hypothetical protein